MIEIEVIARSGGSRRWERDLVARLRVAGHRVSVRSVERHERGARELDLALGLGRPGTLAVAAPPLNSVAPIDPDLSIDLAGTGAIRKWPVLTLLFNGSTDLPAGLARMLSAGLLPEVEVCLDGALVRRAAPLLEDRVWLGRMADCILGAAITTAVAVVTDFVEGCAVPGARPRENGGRTGLVASYLPVLASGLGYRLASRLGPRRPELEFQVGYRLIDGPGVADTAGLAGVPFNVLDDDGRRFYADPFVFEHDSRTCMFVEELPFESGKAVISVSELGHDGRFGTPRQILEEAHHLSYPQVFAQDGEIFMLPESSSSNELVLYRAIRYPDRWERDTVLLADTNISDATLVRRSGRFWLVGTSRIGLGSYSDTMVIYSADGLRGPWRPHRRNPILIDRAAARPGGAMVETRGRLVLPVQDGSRAYGGGLGLVELLALDDDIVKWGAVRPVRTGSEWRGRGIHTLNRAGRVEVIDGVR